MKYTHVLWDFNGTIYNDAEASRKATNVLLKDRGLKQIETIEQLRDKFCFPVKDYYKSLGFDYAKDSYEDIAVKWSVLYNEFSKSSGLVDGVSDVITKLDELGYVQSIISASEYNLLRAKLSVLGIDRAFADISGTADNNAHSKIQIALDWRKYNPDAVAVVIGDTTHDYEVASAIHADCVLYSGGFVSRDRLEQCGCPVIGSFYEIWQYVIDGGDYEIK